MFKTKTVFVVGAGGSYELGLPLGDELKETIAKKVNFHVDYHSRILGNRELYSTICSHCNGGTDLNNFNLAGRNMTLALPLALSIDNYLHTHSDNEKAVLLGKMVIVQSILEAEKKSKIYFDNQNNIDFSKALDSWHNIFCQILTERSDKNDLEKIFENITFITFNYDRCIEHYLALWLEIYIHISRADAQSLVNHMTIIHPYGKVGSLGWQSGSTCRMKVDFGQNLTGNSLLNAASNIRTFTEKNYNAGEAMHIHALLKDAQRIVYLGFSFGEMNMDLIRMNSEHCDSNDYTRKIVGTALGISPNDLDVIKQTINLHYFGTKGRLTFGNAQLERLFSPPYYPNDPKLEDLSCYDFFKQNSRVLSS